MLCTFFIKQRSCNISNFNTYIHIYKDITNSPVTFGINFEVAAVGSKRRNIKQFLTNALFVIPEDNISTFIIL